MKYRGFSEACYQLIESTPGLRALLEQICHDPVCCVEIRNNYLNCYYRGRSLFKMEFKVRSKRVEFKFDSRYFALKKVPCELYEDLKEWNESSPGAPEQWMKQLEKLKQVIDAWLEEHPRPEREIQQEIVKNNTFVQGNHQSIDIELAIPRDQKAGRMDIIAVRREGNQYVPVIVELKHGTGSFDQKSGIRDHYNKTTRFLKSADGDNYLVETIRRIWAAKRRLGLLEDPVPDASAFARAELLFAVTGWPQRDVSKIRRRLPEELTRIVRVATSPTKELYFDSGELLNES